MPSTRQALFVRYFTATLVDLVVLNLFDEFWSYVVIGWFTISLFASVVMQLLLKLTLWIEHKVANFFKSKEGGWAKFMRYFSAWAILFGSKFVILEVVDIAFGDKVHFGGPWHGVVSFITVIVVMLVAEEMVLRIYRRLS